jgi:alkylated DNA nucleotide flippase Atl1/endonuclease/exonuclease/phosphatase family metal-dependent hydrolase
MSPESRADRILARIRAIPEGFVQTYGDVDPRAPRLVGRVLATTTEDVPWHRVVRADGSVPMGAHQIELLRAEGVPMRGERVDLGRALWPGRRHRVSCCARALDRAPPRAEIRGAPGRTEGNPMAKLRVMTWNVENFLPVGHEDGPKTEAEFAEKVASLARLIDGQQPDVLTLQEVGDVETLAQLQEGLGHKMPHAQVSAHPDRRGIRCAILSVHDLGDPLDVHGLPDRIRPVQVGDPDEGGEVPTSDHMGRGAIQASFEVGGRQVTVLTAHFKSKLLTYPGKRFQPRDEDERARFGGYALGLREAEAVTVRCHMDAVLAGEGRERAVIFAGDLNDEISAGSTLLVNGPPGSELDSAGFNQKDNGERWRMYNLLLKLAADKRGTRKYRGRFETIDHIFASDFLARKLEAVAVTPEPGGLRSIDEDPSGEQGKPGSDHAAVMATFDLS